MIFLLRLIKNYGIFVEASDSIQILQVFDKSNGKLLIFFETDYSISIHSLLLEINEKY